MLKLYIIIILNLFLVLPGVFIQESQAAKSWLKQGSFGIGSYTPYVGKIQTSAQGSDTNKFEFNPYVSLALDLSLFNSLPKLTITPQLDLGIPKSSRDSNISKWYYRFITWSSYEFGAITPKAGLGFAMTQISGDGGSQTLNNFDSQDSFPIPDGTQTSVNTILTLAGEYKFLKNYSFQAELYAFDLLSSESRSLSYALNFRYYIDFFNKKKTPKKRKYRRRIKKKKDKTDKELKDLLQ